MEQDKFGPPDATLINAVVSVVRTAKTDVGENPAKLDAWRDAIHGAVQPYLKEGPGDCQSYTQAGRDCGVRLSTREAVLLGVCSRHGNHDWVTGACNGVNCVTKAPCLHCEGRRGGDTMHCLCCGRPIHAECLTEWMQEVCPSKAGQFNVERDIVVCANCLWRRWPMAVILYHLEKLDDAAVRMLVLPEGAKEVWPESPTRSATFEKFAEQYKRGAVLSGVLTILPDRPAPGQSTPARGLRRGAGGPQGRGQGGSRARRSLAAELGEGSGEDDSDGERTPVHGGAEPPAGTAGADQLQEVARLRRELQRHEMELQRGHGGPATGRGGGMLPTAPPPPQGELGLGRREDIMAMVNVAVRQQMGDNIANFHDSTPGALALTRNGVAVLDGSYVGVKEGELGAASCLQICFVETYDGNGPAAGRTGSLVVQSVMGPRCKNIADDGTAKSGPDHDGRKGMAFDPETGLLIEGSSTKGKIPQQTTAFAWFSGRHDQLQGARECNEGVMRQDHPVFLKQFQRISLVMARYRFLQVIAEQLLTHYGLPWPVVWRYICYVSARHWQAAGEAITVVDRQLIEAARYADYRPHMRACFMPDMALVAEAKKMAGVSGDSAAEVETLRELKQIRQELRQIQQQGGSGSGSGKPQGRADKKAKDADREPPKKCGLCNSTEHVYYAGAYLHPADEPITNRCPRTKDGKQCKLYHAYTGDLKSPCEF